MKGSKTSFRIRTIRGSLLVPLVLLLVLVSVIFFIYSLHYTDANVRRNSIDYTVQLIDQVNNDIDSYITYMENISEIVSKRRNVRNYLFLESLSAQREQELHEEIAEQFATMMNVREDIYNIAVISDNGRRMIGDGSRPENPYADIQNAQWYKQAMESENGITLSSSHVQNILSGSYTWVVTLSRRLSDPYHVDRRGAMLFVDLNYQAIQDLCERISLGKRGYIYILDQEGQILYHPQQQLIYSGIKSELIQEVLECRDNYFQTKGRDAKLYTVSRSEKTGWTVVGVSYMDELVVDRKDIERTYAFVVVLLLLFAMLAISLIAGRITKPLMLLKDVMQSSDTGHLNKVDMTDVPDNEIGALSQSFNVMTDQIHRLIEENKEEQRQKRHSEQRALQAQINPHFLYNTLDSIIWMAESGKNDEVVLMTASLARMMRSTLNSQQEIVTIEQEMLHVRSYLTIQQMRYRDKLEFEIDIDPEIRQVGIVKLVVQPLVENAIYHGIKYKENKGWLQITGRREGDRVVISITDSGQGMDQDTLKNIFKKHKVNYTNNGVGVYNVQSRLQLYYGEEYGLHYESSPGCGTTVRIVIPYDQEGYGYEI